jgi:uncharacterized protein
MDKHCRRICTPLFLLLLFCCHTLLAQQKSQKWKYTDVPDPKASPSWNYVSNPDSILSNDAVITINNYLKDLEDSTADQVAIVIVKDIQKDKTPREFATSLFRHWGIGQKDKNNGLLILLVVDQRRMEFEVGYGLESTLTDILTKQIQERYMVPYAKSGDYDNCVLAGVKQVVAVLKHEPPPVEEPTDFATPDDNSISYANTYGDNSTRSINKMPVLLILFAVLLIYFFIKKFIFAKTKLNETNSFRTVRYQLVQFFINLVFIAAIFLSSIFEHFWQLAICVYLFFLIKQVVKAQAILKYSQSAHLQFTDRVETYKNIRLHRLAVPRFLQYIFPFPNLFFIKKIDRVIDEVRNQPVFSSDGRPMQKLSEEADDAYLKANQVYEEGKATVDYDVWKAMDAEEQKIFRYELFSKYEACPACETVAYKLTSDHTIEAATYESSGEGEKTYTCGYCHHVKKVRYTIPRKQRSSSSSGSSGSSSSSGGSSWGGGSSGGGGSGSSW